MPRRAAVIVLGDLGHSPRMQYHCQSLLSHGLHVDFIGYRGSAPYQSLLQHPNLRIRYLPECPPVPSFVGLFLKLIWQFFALFMCICFVIQKSDFILLQNPPGLPAILVCWLCAKLGRTGKFLIDWHNYTFSMFALRYASTGWFVKIVEFYEFGIGRLADGGFCVTEAMKIDLTRRGIPVITHSDRASQDFRPLLTDEKREFLTNISEAVDELACLLEPKQSLNSDNNNCNDDKKSAAMVISSTSWTPDENFDLLLEALKLYDESFEQMKNLPRLVLVVTGKGPLKSYYVQKANEYGFQNVAIATPWLTAEDYPKLLACADIGLSLHYSSSGLDFPMKIVDMQGCGLPVLSADFQCASEIIRDGQNGFLFRNDRKLFELLVLLLHDLRTNELLIDLKRRCLADQTKRPHWDQAWDDTVWPYLMKVLRK